MLTYGIPLPQATLDALQTVTLPAPTPTLEACMGSMEQLRQYARQDNGLQILKLYLAWIPQLEQQYRKLGIAESVFRDSLRDLTIWAEDYYDKYHTPGFREWEWVSNTFFLKVFRLGRLQFEPSQLEEAVTLADQDFPAGTTVLEVHIPAGEPLDPTAVKDAMEQAPAFFRAHFRKEFTLMRCHSWLLCPKLQVMLPPQSRILTFQDLFTVYCEDPERQAEERVFGYLSDDPALYPEVTSLQRSLKNALLAGQAVGMGKGIRKIP